MQPRTAPIRLGQGLGRRLAALGAISILAGACSTAAPASSPTGPAATQAQAATSVPAMSQPTPGPTPFDAGVLPKNGLIVFYRTDDARSTNTPFSIEPDGTHETKLHDGGLLPGAVSPDGTRIAVHQLVKDPSPMRGAESAWIRPAVVNADGSGYRLLNAYPD